MSRILVMSFDAGGNFPPALGLAQRLLADGHDVLLLAHPEQQDDAAAAGVQFEAFSTEQVYRPLTRTSLARNLAEITSTLSSRSLGRELVAVAQRFRPDVVVIDCMLIAAIEASVRAGFRTVPLVHTLPSFWAGPFAHGPVGMVTALRGARMRRTWGSTHGTLATVPAGFDSYTSGPFADLQWVGPIAARLMPPDQPVTAPPDASSDPPRTRPGVLISLSTIRFAGQDRTLQKLLDAVDGLDLDVVMTTGRSIDPTALRAPSNVELHAMLDHERILPRVDLVVGHGGFGTTMRALTRGLPLLIIPSFDLIDQPAVGRRVADLGLGRSMSRRSSIPLLRNAIRDLAGPGPHRVTAAAFGEKLRAADPAGAAAAYLAQLAS